MKKQIRIWLVFAFAVLCLTAVSCSENGSEGERSYSIYVDSESSIRVEDLTVHQWAELDNQTATEQQVTDGYFVEKFFGEYRRREAPEGLYLSETHYYPIRPAFTLRADLWKSRSKYYWFVYAVASDTYYLGDVIDSRNGSFCGALSGIL